MKSNTVIKTSKRVYPQIYAYITPQVQDNDGWVKIGYTEQYDVHLRIKQQTHTANIPYKLLWSHTARFAGDDGEWFRDKQLHAYLRQHKQVQQRKSTEWFYYNGDQDRSSVDFEEFVHSASQVASSKLEYTLRQEQLDAVERTLEYARLSSNGEFLWNAKPRFGKTLATYDLCRRLDATRVLILTNRPAIANSWYDDFERYIDWKTDYTFVSTSDSLRDRPTVDREQFVKLVSEGKTTKDRMLAFVSLQDLKGSLYFGGEFDKLKWIKELDFDILVIDEAHEGVDTFKTDVALDNIRRNFTLHLSGTPFKALASGRFGANQIYNWTYADEQAAKANWTDIDKDSPYANLPRLNLFSYQMSQMITDQVNQGADIDGNNIDYAFDLNEFFATNDSGKLIHESDVLKWCDTLTTLDKYPFSTIELREQLKHTFWLLNRVASARALSKLLKSHQVFKDYHIVLAAGEGRDNDDQQFNLKSLAKVKHAVKHYDKTITLSVGQLTTGVTIPEWSAVLMLCNLKSPSLYMQAAFRAQNPYQYEIDDVLYHKDNAYVFDFAPERTLKIYDEFANNLDNTVDGQGTTQDRVDNIKSLLNWFPVIAEDSDGKMCELDVNQVLTIPKVIKAQEVVRRGFMSNLLFCNISGIFASASAREILEQLNSVGQAKVVPNKTNRHIDTQGVQVDQDGRAVVPTEIVIRETQANFGDKVYMTHTPIKSVETDTQDKLSDNIAQSWVDNTKDQFGQLAKDKGIPAKTVDKILKDTAKDIAQDIERIQTQTNIRLNEVKAERDRQVSESNQDETKIQLAQINYERQLHSITQEYNQELADTIDRVDKQAVQDTTHKILETAETTKKDKIEDDVRSRLRGFARTIPSFLMAYGDSNTTLANFDTIVKDEVFKEVTGINLDQFKALRDTYQFFDSVVFDQSCQEFDAKKSSLANYWDDAHTQDIFDYIPPQQTNQIYTPKRVVNMMLDNLERDVPGIFGDETRTFVDLYTKSGLYLAMIAKRLYNGLKDKIPDSQERLRHILTKQVYGLAPSEIIYNIARNFVYGCVQDSTRDCNIVHLDMIPYAKGMHDWDAKCRELWRGGKTMFDVVVGNPPYQLNDEGLRDDGKANASASPIFQYFFGFACSISNQQTLIMPAKFLSGAGKGLQDFANQVVEDDSIKSIYVYPNSNDIFDGVDIKGGITYFCRDQFWHGIPKVEVHSQCGVEVSHRPLKDGIANVFVPFVILSSILTKVDSISNLALNNIATIVSARKPYGLRTDFLKFQSKYNLPQVSTRRLEQDDIKIVGLIDNKRVERYVDQNYPFAQMENYTSRVKQEFDNSLHKYKVFVPKAYGAGSLGERFGTPIIGTPNTICTENFILVGTFDNEESAINIDKYIKTKFCRVLIGILKTTHDNSKRVWSCVPLQDFTSDSDIDWSQSIADIDKQLYVKYGLDNDEIAFIDTNVKSME
jgi:superfamily II DNA or RNA helicase